MSLDPRAALLVVLGEDEHHRLSATAFAEEAVRVAVRGGSSNGDGSPPKLVVKRLGSLTVA